MTAPGASSKFTIRLALCAATAGALACLWTAWCLFPCLAWNELRLAPAFALRQGINPYPPLGGGPVTTWIYGPVGILVDLPATCAASPEGALHLASLITILAVLAPLAVIFFGSAELRARGAWAPWLALCLGVLLQSERNFMFQVADQSSIALGLLSGWCLARHPEPQTSSIVGAAALCALAIFTKQLEVFLVPAHLVFLLMGGHRVAAVRYLAWLALFSLVALVICAPAFGLANLWLNVVVIPGRLPWADFVARLAARPWILTAQVALPSLGLALLWRIRRWPDGSPASGRFFHWTVLAYFAMLPVGLAAFFKIGGDANSLHSWNYLLPGCLLAWLATDRGATIPAARLLGVTTLALVVHGMEFAALPIRPLTRHFEEAAQLNSAFPHAIWFPQNPIITFYADGNFWHVEDGVRTRNYAGFAPRQADFRRYLPANLQAIAYPTGEDLWLSMALLPEFSQKTVLPHWTLLTRPPPRMPAAP